MEDSALSNFKNITEMDLSNYIFYKTILNIQNTRLNSNNQNIERVNIDESFINTISSKEFKAMLNIMRNNVPAFKIDNAIEKFINNNKKELKEFKERYGQRMLNDNEYAINKELVPVQQNIQVPVPTGNQYFNINLGVLPVNGYNLPNNNENLKPIKRINVENNLNDEEELNILQSNMSKINKNSIKKFSSLSKNEKVKRDKNSIFDNANKVKINDVVGESIIIISYRILTSAKQKRYHSDFYVRIFFFLNNKLCYLNSGSSVLLKDLQSVGKVITEPFKAVINTGKSKNGSTYYYLADELEN